MFDVFLAAALTAPSFFCLFFFFTAVLVVLLTTTVIVDTVICVLFSCCWLRCRANVFCCFRLFPDQNRSVFPHQGRTGGLHKSPVTNI